tara:strand:- start:1717 stop:2046 length:330 start_codon:yes stop_codon:yes gene_type:complete
MNNDNKCYVCNKQVEKHESALRLGVLAGEFPSKVTLNNLKFLGYVDKHIACSPSRAQHIVHPEFPPVKDERVQYNKDFWDRSECSKYQSLYTNAWVVLQLQSDKKLKTV